MGALERVRGVNATVGKGKHWVEALGLIVKVFASPCGNLGLLPLSDFGVQQAPCRRCHGSESVSRDRKPWALPALVTETSVSLALSFQLSRNEIQCSKSHYARSLSHLVPRAGILSRQEKKGVFNNRQPRSWITIRGSSGLSASMDPR